MSVHATDSNPFLTGLRKQPPTCQWGLWCSIPSPVTAELCAGAGFDWLLFDMEHSPTDLKDVYAALQACAAYPVSPIVRPPSNDPVAIKRLLDVGVRNLLIPFVQTATQAREAVSAAFYPPTGTRGLTMTSRANGFGRRLGYLTEAAQQVGVIVQIETREALGNLEEIASVEGVSAVFLGPSDLSADMGFLGQPNAPDVRDAIAGAARTLAGMGMPWGILVGSTQLAAFYASLGASYVAAGSDLGLLRKATDDMAATLRAAPAERAA